MLNFQGLSLFIDSSTTGLINAQHLLLVKTQGDERLHQTVSVHLIIIIQLIDRSVAPVRKSGPSKPNVLVEDSDKDEDEILQEAMAQISAEFNNTLPFLMGTKLLQNFREEMRELKRQRTVSVGESPAQGRHYKKAKNM